MDVPDGEIGVSSEQQSEMRELLELAALLGRDPLAIQGPGGNISLKREGVMWVKASGTWMMEAITRSILVPVDIAAVLDGLAAGDPACETCSAFVRRDLANSPLRPSIETTLHAVMPQRVVVHVHCVETISLACLSDAAERLAAPLNGLNWTFVPYIRPGASLGRTIAKQLRAGTNVVVLGKHGLVVAADNVAEAARLRAEVSSRLARQPRAAAVVDRDALRGAEGFGYSTVYDDALHAIATDPVSLAAARRGSLYPDHVVFLGPGVIAADGKETAADAARRAGRPDAPLVVVPGKGVLLHEAATPAARALVRCLADVTCRIAKEDVPDPLTAAEEGQLLNWDAEKYRQSLDQRSP
jgi:rhamnose utilization protein RhaD (predicted bifunctional aldolase and dehydrogenase)